MEGVFVVSGVLIFFEEKFISFGFGSRLRRINCSSLRCSWCLKSQNLNLGVLLNYLLHTPDVWLKEKPDTELCNLVAIKHLITQDVTF